MGKLRTIIVIIALVLVVAAGAFAAGMFLGDDGGSATPASPTAAPVSTASPSSGFTSSPTTAPVSTTQPSQSVMSTDPLVGSWHGTKSLFFGIATADFSLTARPDGTMTISGTADAPVAGYENVPFSTEADWNHLSGTTYLGSIGDRSLEFTCDGAEISLSVNPYAMGLVDYEALDMDIGITLTRV